jgi:allophanate hydrolase
MGRVAQIAADVAAGRTTALQVAEEALAAIEAYDALQPQVWIARTPREAVLARARAVDAKIAAGDVLPLAGVPFAVKDNIDAAGLPTTAACPAFAYEPAADAEVVARLLAAGAIMMGKSNLDQFATGLVGVRSPHGAPQCVFNRDYVSGGSSSGSAVAVGAGLVAFSLGTDTAGSGRVPAAFNNLVGLKPTKGRWSTTGLVPACRSLDCITVFAADVADAGLVDSVAAGFDAADPYSRWGGDVRPFGPAFKFGVPSARQLQFFGDLEAEAMFFRAVARLEAMGGTAVEVNIQPLLDAALLLYAGPWVAERTAAAETILKENPDAIDPTVRTILESGVGVTGVETFRGLYKLQEYARQAEAVWREVGILLLPTTGTIYRLRELRAAPIALNSNLGRYTNFVNLLDMSAIALPAGFRNNGTGFGVTLMAPAWADRALLDLGRRYEEIAPMPQAPSLDLEGKPQTVEVAVVGAHLEGMPLHWQLVSRDAKLVAKTKTAPVYKLYAMTDTIPMKPALIRVAEGGAAIEVEVYELSLEHFGSFTVEVQPPLAMGTVTLESGEQIKGFVAEPRAMDGASDITELGGWRAFMATQG